MQPVVSKVHPHTKESTLASSTNFIDSLLTMLLYFPTTISPIKESKSINTHQFDTVNSIFFSPQNVNRMITPTMMKKKCRFRGEVIQMQTLPIKLDPKREATLKAMTIQPEKLLKFLYSKQRGNQSKTPQTSILRSTIQVNRQIGQILASLLHTSPNQPLELFSTFSFSSISSCPYGSRQMPTAITIPRNIPNHIVVCHAHLKIQMNNDPVKNPKILPNSAEVVQTPIEKPSFSGEQYRMIIVKTVDQLVHWKYPNRAKVMNKTILELIPIRGYNPIKPKEIEEIVTNTKNVN